MKSIIRIIFLTLAITRLAGCSDSLLVEEPPHIISGEVLFADYNGFQSAINGLYAKVREEKSGRNSEDMIAGMFMDGTDALVSNHRIAGFSMISQLWRENNNASNEAINYNFLWLYSIVNAANTIMERGQSDGVDWTGGNATPDENKNRILSEAHAIRAWAYRHLSFTWGNVPLNLTESTGSAIRTDWERAPVTEVRRQIIADLLTAEPHIPTEPYHQGSLTKGAVQHYLSELYLTIGKPDSALYWANQAIGNPAYRLVENRYGVKATQPGVPIMDMFTEGNQSRNQGNSEALWVFQFQFETQGGGSSGMRRYHAARFSDWIVDGVKPIRDTYDRGGRGRSRMSLTKWFLELYEPEDHRNSEFAIRRFFILKDASQNAPFEADTPPPGYQYGDTLWMNWDGDITPTTLARMDWPFSRKVEGTSPNNAAETYQWNDQVYLRLADTYLLKAEAQFRLGDPEGAAATINVIRRRSNASEITAADVTLDYILDERARELVIEEHRRHTLLRTGKWLERTKKHNKNGGQLIAERDTLLPLPQSVIDANLTNKMPQNPGF